LLFYYHCSFRSGLISFNNSTPKTSIRRKDLRDHLYMLPILCQISLLWQRGLIARPKQPPTRCKDVDDISYTNRVIVYSISNFVAMATGVGSGGICLTAFNSPTPKTFCCVQESRRYLPQKPSYCLFCIKFSLPWQQGLVVVEFV